MDKFKSAFPRRKASPRVSDKTADIKILDPWEKEASSVYMVSTCTYRSPAIFNRILQPLTFDSYTTSQIPLFWPCDQSSLPMEN